MSKNLFIGIVSIVSLFGGLIAGVIGFVRLQDYEHTLRPFLAFAVAGFLSGLFLWSRMQKSLERTVPAELRKGTSSFGTIIGFIGFGIYFGTVINTAISTGTTYNCEIEQKSHSLAGSRSVPRYYLYVKLNNKPTTIRCSYEYWNVLFIGDTIPVTYMKSPLGYNFIALPDED